MPDREKANWDGIPRVVHVLSMTQSGCARAARMVARAAERSGRRVAVDERVFGGRSLHPGLGQPLDGCAAVVVLSRNSADDDLFTRAVHAIVERCAAGDDFRVYLILDDLTPEQFHELAGLEFPLFEYLRENIQLGTGQQEDAQPTTGLSENEVEPSLADYLDKLRDVQSRAAWRRLKANTSISLGRVALAIQLVSPIILFSGWMLMKTGWASRSGVDIGIQREAVTLSAGVLHFWASMLPAYFVLRGFSAPSAAARDAQWIMRKFMFCALVSLAALKIAFVAGAGNRWLVLGIALGACVDGARRAGLQAQRVRHGLEPLSDNPEIAGLTANLAGVGPANIFHLPIWPAISQSLVISYARASKWSYALASELFSALEKAKIPVFLDRVRIPLGSSWRRELQYEIGGANTFICILDQAAAKRPWVAAEFFNALRGQALTGSPKVLVLESPGLNLGEALPVFARALNEDTPEGTRMHVLRRIRVSGRTVEVLSHELQPALFQTESVVPQTIAVLLEGVLRPITILCAFAAMVGLLAWVGWVVEMWKEMPIFHWLHPRTASILFLLIAYMAGCGCRLTVVSRFQIRHETPGSLAASQAIGAIGLLLFCAAWFRAFPPLIQGWVLVAVVFGWWRAGSFFSYSVLGDRTLMRS